MTARGHIGFSGTAFLLASLLVTPVAHAQDYSADQAGEASRLLTLEECLEIADVSNITLQRARLGIEASLLDRIRKESFFDPGFELDLSVQRNEAGDSRSQADLALRYRFPTWEGSMWVFSLGQSRSTGTSYPGGSAAGYTAHTSQVGLSYSLPLLEGRGERINRLAVERADLSVIRSEAAANESARSLRLSIIHAYIGAVLAARRIDVAGLSLETAQNLVQEVRARIDVGQLPEYELLAAQAGLAERQETLLNAEAGLATTLDTLKELIGLPLTDDIRVDPGTLRPIYLEVDPDELFFLAQRNRADLRDIDLRVRQAQLDLLLATDRRQSTLAWNTVLGFSGQGEDYVDSLQDLEHFSWYTGLEYRLPLGGNRAARVDVGSAQLALEQLELERVDFLRNVLRDIRSACEDFRNALLRTDVTTQGLEVQEVKIDKEQTRLELGLITSRDLLEFDLDFANARLAYDTALADTLLALAKLEYLINDRLESLFHFPDEGARAASPHPSTGVRGGLAARAPLEGGSD